MAFCTIVEFEWEGPEPKAAFESMLSSGDLPTEVPGRIARVVGIDDRGARAIEVWRSHDDARQFAASSHAAATVAKLPAPTRAFGFEVTTFDLAT
jgi:hypothetical protein